MRLTWPSQRSQLWLSKANTQGTSDCARTSLFGTRSCQVIPKMLLRQHTWRCCVCVLGGSRGSRSCYTQQGAEHAGLVQLHLVLMVNLVLSQALQSTCQCCCCCFANSFFSSVSRESCWRCWSLQSWTKVLGTVLQYSYFSVISRFPLKTVHHFGNFLAVLPPLTLYKVETRKNSGRASNVVCGGEERGWTCVNWKTPHQRKSVPRLLSMIVGKWSPPPPRVLSRWRCLAHCWRLGQEVLVFLRLMVRPNSLQMCAKELQAPSEAGRLWWVSTLLVGGCLAWGGR